MRAEYEKLASEKAGPKRPEAVRAMPRTLKRTFVLLESRTTFTQFATTHALSEAF